MTLRFFLWPLPPEFSRVTSPFGPRRHPVTGETGTFHGGIDIACPHGTEVRAPCDGEVRNVWNDKAHGGGLSLTIRRSGCPATYRFGFAHLSQVFVAAGDRVKQGQLVALSGGTPGTEGAGRSTGPHLHLTVRRVIDSKLVDPLKQVWTPESLKTLSNVRIWTPEDFA